MVEAGIYPDDILVVDRSLRAGHGDIVIASLDGEMTVKVLETTPVPRLMPRNPNYHPIPIPEGCELEIFGVVTNVVRSLRKG
jgi:DNA polymerase V